MGVKPSLPKVNVSALVVLLVGALMGLSCGSLATGALGSSQESNSELEGPIEELLFTASGVPNQLRIYGVTVNIEGARIELDSDILLDPRDLALTRFVEVEFAGFNVADEVEVEEAEAEGRLLNLETFNPSANITVNFNPRTIDATFTVLGAGILCDNDFTRVQLNGQVGGCELLSQLNGLEVEVEGLVVNDFALSLSDLSPGAPIRDVILAAEIELD